MTGSLSDDHALMKGDDDGQLRKMLTPPTFLDIERHRMYLKERLVVALRIFAKHDFDLIVTGHISVRDPGDPESFWVNPFGLAFSLVTVSDLVLVDHSGAVIGGGKPGRRIVNRAGFEIHSAIHIARPDVLVVCHSHSTYGKAFSSLGKSLDMITLDACSFYNDIAVYSDFGGIAIEQSEGTKIAAALGKNKAAILQNHGLLTVGKYIESAVVWFILLEKQCQVQLLADAAAAGRGRDTVKVSNEAAEFTYRTTGGEDMGYFSASPYFQAVEAELGDSYKA